WFRETLETTAIMNDILHIIHPSLYYYGLRAQQAIRDQWGHEQAAELWVSVYTGCLVIANRETPLHRDPNCWYGWYDLLALVGKYDGTETWNVDCD
ncbi:hypothetical protein JAAARDRAFT_143682, partial [Jaapia argillacea MUCL 33604]